MKEFFSFTFSTRPFLIAEAGTSHGGNLQKAEELVYAAAESGADCVKFQLVIAEEIIHPKTGTVRLPGGSIPLYETFRSLEQTPEFFAAIQETAEKAGIRFLCTPFGIRSARLLRELGADMLKIASPELNHVPLLEEITGYGIPLIISTGVSTLSDIDEALRLLRGGTAAGGSGGAHAVRPAGDGGHSDAVQNGPNIVLLHCITAYPAPEEEYNLRCIPNLAAVFGVPAGISDHSLGPVLVPVLAAALGAAIIEKHICLDRTGGGLDDPIALVPSQFAEMVREVRRTEKRKDASGQSAAVEELRRECGAERVNAVLGDGVKRLSPSEAANYGRSNRSVHALMDLPAGTVLTGENIAVLRTEKVLRPGLHPRYYHLLQGKRLSRQVEAGEGITWGDLLS